MDTSNVNRASGKEPIEQRPLGKPEEILAKLLENLNSSLGRFGDSQAQITKDGLQAMIEGANTPEGKRKWDENGNRMIDNDELLMMARHIIWNNPSKPEQGKVSSIDAQTVTEFLNSNPQGVVKK